MSYSNTPAGDITITQGDSGLLVLEYFEPDGVTPRDLTGLKAKISIARVKVNENTGETTISDPVYDDIVDPNLNEEGDRHRVRFAFKPADMALLKVQKHVYEVELTDGFEFVETKDMRAFNVKPQLIKKAV